MSEPPAIPNSQLYPIKDEVKLIKFNDNAIRAKFVFVAFGAFIILYIVGLYSGFLEIGLITDATNGIPITDEMAEKNDERQQVIQVFQFISFLITIPVFLTWFWNAHGKLHELGRTDLKFEQSATAYMWFIPILNWFQPYRMMMELWNNIQTEIQLEKPSYVTQNGDFIIGFWWFLFLATNIAGKIIVRGFSDMNTIDEILLGSKLIFIVDSVKIIEAVVVILIVFTISKKETVLEKIFSKK